MGIVTCVSGIDTDIGKTIATGVLANALNRNGYSVITMKVAQTGCKGIAEDIVQHRKLMEIDLFAEDIEGLTCPYVFQKPCSPHLAAELENQVIDTTVITGATEKLARKFDHILLEGVGGLQVPLNRETTFLDYVQERGYPVILVSSPRLGSINHTLAALELAKVRGIRIQGIVYNLYEDTDPLIKEDSRVLFLKALEKYGFSPRLINLDAINTNSRDGKEFSCLQLFIE